ncbi:hypothetical protein EIK77_000836 [Talaromyces pinophilus]|nr:hypothetical protein EIK77_000124 [Talaromyces pinophilus]KAI7973723.1 hypothetical protein EIK77_000225 [Talaromyces pinophilus]KAI7978760.1 hypothetical protein EIK77_000836 [Talaromyces pinophilus]
MVDERTLVVARTTGVEAIVGVTNAEASDVAGELGDPVVSQSPVGAAVEEAGRVMRSSVDKDPVVSQSPVDAAVEEAGRGMRSAGDMKPLVAGGTSRAQVALAAASVGDAGVEGQREEIGSGMTHLATC